MHVMESHFCHIISSNVLLSLLQFLGKQVITYCNFWTLSLNILVLYRTFFEPRDVERVMVGVDRVGQTQYFKSKSTFWSLDFLCLINIRTY